MISFDVESLFTNVPIDETIEFIKNTCFKLKQNHHIVKKKSPNDSKYERLFDGRKFKVFLNKSFKRFLKSFRKTFKKMFQESIFIFNNKISKQIDVVSMGFPLSPIIANIFMNNFENKHMEKPINKGLKYWDRFVDDTCVIARSKDNADEIYLS